MQGVVLAAGKGTRLRQLTDDQPKGLVDIGGRPLLDYCFETLVDAGVDQLVVVVGYRSEDIVDHYGNEFRDVPITYTHQEEQLGLAHALLTTTDVIDEDFAVINGDNIYGADLGHCLAHHRETGADATLLVSDVDEATAREGATCKFDEDGNVFGLVEKPDNPPSTRRVLGFHTFSPRIFEHCRRIEPSGRGEYELTDAVSRMFEGDARVETVEYDGWRINVNTRTDIEAAAERLER